MELWNDHFHEILYSPGKLTWRSLENQQFLIGGVSTNGCFSIAMFFSGCILTHIFNHEVDTSILDRPVAKEIVQHCLRSG